MRPISFNGASRAMAVLGHTHRGSWVDVGNGVLRALTGWTFSLEVPLVEALRFAERAGSGS